MWKQGIPHKLLEEFLKLKLGNSESIAVENYSWEKTHTSRTDFTHQSKNFKISSNWYVNFSENPEKHLTLPRVGLKRFHPTTLTKIAVDEDFTPLLLDWQSLLIIFLLIAATSADKVDTAFIENAVHELLNARRVLRASYAYGYFLTGNKDKKAIFESMQARLCSGYSSCKNEVNSILTR